MMSLGLNRCQLRLSGRTLHSFFEVKSLNLRSLATTIREVTTWRSNPYHSLSVHLDFCCRRARKHAIKSARELPSDPASARTLLPTLRSSKKKDFRIDAKTMITGRNREATQIISGYP